LFLPQARVAAGAVVDAAPVVGRCAAVDAGKTGLAVPHAFAAAVLEFVKRGSNKTTVVQGGRRSVYVEGAKSEPFRKFAAQKTDVAAFLTDARCAIACRAASTLTSRSSFQEERSSREIF
jgi:hypothetical protein